MSILFLFMRHIIDSVASKVYEKLLVMAVEECTSRYIYEIWNTRRLVS